MAIANFRIKKISAEKKERETKETSNIDVSSNFVIHSMTRKKEARIGEYLLVNFAFNVRYKPALGSIDLEGSLWYTTDDLSKNVTEKDGKVEVKAEALQEISTNILRDSLIESVDIARKLRLPLPINLPKVNVKPKELKFPKAG